MKFIFNYFLKDIKFNSNIEHFKAKILTLFILSMFLLLIGFIILSIVSNNLNTTYTQTLYFFVGIASLFLIKKGKFKIVGNGLSLILVITEITSMFFNFSNAAPFNFFIDEYYLLLIFLMFSAIFAKKYILFINTFLIIISTVVAYILNKDSFPQEFYNEFSFGIVIYIITTINIFIFSYIYTHIVNKAMKEVSVKALDAEQKNTKLVKSKSLLENKQVELTTALKKVKESDLLKTNFLANMSHELRTPMNAILGFSELLLNSELSKKQIEYLKIIDNSGKHLLRLIDDIMNVSRLEAKKIKIVEESFNLNILLDEIIKYSNLQLKKTGKTQIKITSNYAFKEHCNILIDSKCLRQIFINLINNAIKFTFVGEINISYKLQQNNELIFCIKDTGIGIKKEQIPIIFDRFRQADETTTRQFGGSGLGLSISKSCVELLGGEIWVKSEVDKGSEFYFTIPYKQIN